jgi:CRP-like cAMP-binding protein
VRKRIAIALLELAKIQQSNTFKASRQDLAAMAGTAVETAIRILSEFNKDGYIKSKGSTITLLQPEKLKNLPF